MPGDVALSLKNKLFEKLVEDTVGVEPFPVEGSVIHGLLDYILEEVIGEVAFSS